MGTVGQAIGAGIGAVVGGIVGSLIPGVGTVMGAIYGASLGYTIGGIIDPVRPDVRTPGSPAQPVQITSNTVGSPIPDVLGTAKITGFLLAYGNERAEPQYEKVKTGGKGGKKKTVKQLTGYKYYATWALGICMGPVDSIYTIFKDDDVVWTGDLSRPQSGGEETIVIDNLGTVTIYFGTSDQNANSVLAGILPDSTLNTGWRGLCWVLFNDCFMNTYNRMPTMTFVIRKTPKIPQLSSSGVVQAYDYNPSHAIYYILRYMVGLSDDWLHSGDFDSVASSLAQEGRGISVLLDAFQPALTYLQSINSHIDSVLRYGTDGKFHPKLIRYDYDINTLPEINESHLLESPSITRRSWIDTIGEVKVQYSQITAERYEEDTMIGFLPRSNVIFDGDFIYIGGMYQSEGHQYFCVRKLWKSNGGYINQFIKTYTDVYTENHNGCVWLDLVGNYLYAMGSIIPDGSSLIHNVIYKIRTSDMSEVWERYFTYAQNSDYVMPPSCVLVDGNYVYVTGNYGVHVAFQRGYRRKYTTDGELVDQKSDIYSAQEGIIENYIGSAYLIIAASGGGIRRFDKVPKINIQTAVEVDDYNPIYYYHKMLRLYIDPEGGNVFYYVAAQVGSQTNQLYGAIVKLNSLLGQVGWVGFGGDFHHMLYNCVVDDTGVYFMGLGWRSIGYVPLFGGVTHGLEEKWVYFPESYNPQEGTTVRPIGLDPDTGELIVFRQLYDTEVSAWRGIMEKRDKETGEVLWTTQ